MDTKTAIIQRRTIRRFQQIPIGEDLLREMVALSRLYASGGNLQPIRYMIVAEQPKLDQVFENLRWAAYLPGFEIRDDERPVAYVILTSNADAKRNYQFDLGAAATTLMLAAQTHGIGTCCLGSFHHANLVKIVGMPQDQEPLLVIALGYPAQKSKTVDLVNDVKYYEDEEGCLCVPKRTLDELLTWV